jgi:uncharacterized protein (TIGR02466 family)
MKYSFYYWGPLLFKIKVKEEDIKNIYQICKKDKSKDFRNQLAGIIEQEYLIDEKIYFEIIKKYIDPFKNAFTNWYGKEFNKMEVVKAWVNFMKKNEYNPPHVHGKCNFSSVMYLKIPDKLKIENQKYVGTLKSKGGPGSISFLNAAGNDKFNITTQQFFPEEGDFFIFPSSLLHYVIPFKSSVERISVAANFEVSEFKYL